MLSASIVYQDDDDVWFQSGSDIISFKHNAVLQNSGVPCDNADNGFYESPERILFQKANANGICTISCIDKSKFDIVWQCDYTSKNFVARNPRFGNAAPHVLQSANAVSIISPELEIIKTYDFYNSASIEIVNQRKSKFSLDDKNIYKIVITASNSSKPKIVNIWYNNQLFTGSEIKFLNNGLMQCYYDTQKATMLLERSSNLPCKHCNKYRIDNYVLIPCGHSGFCEDCKDRRKCPECFESVQANCRLK